MRLLSGCFVICCLCVSSFASPQSPRASMDIQHTGINPLLDSVETEIQASIQKSIETFLVSDQSKKLLNKSERVSLVRLNSIATLSSNNKLRNIQHRTAPATFKGESTNKKRYQVDATLSTRDEVFSERFMIEGADKNYEIISVSSIQ